MDKIKIKKFTTPYYLVIEGNQAVAKVDTLIEAKRIKAKLLRFQKKYTV